MIDNFDGPYRFLSNFYKSPVTLDGEAYPTVEHAYQAAKFPVDSRLPFREAATPSIAKRLGRRKGIRPDWESVKLGIMRDLVGQKFQDPTLREKLDLTKPQDLVEGNWWNDTYWGVCRGVGENHLGKLLMEVRDV